MEVALAARDVLRRTFHYYTLVFAALLVLVVLADLPALDRRIAWFGLAWAGLAFAVVAADRPSDLNLRWGPRTPTLLALLGATLLLALLARLLPLRSTRLPVGYDYGFYKATMDHYQSQPFPEATVPAWMSLQFEPGLVELHQVLHAVAGLDSFDHLRTLWPILAAGAVLPVYALARTHFGTGAGFVAASLYAASYAQYVTFQYLYEKNVLALVLLVLAFFALHHRSFVLAGILLGALGTWHRPTFLLAVLALVPYAAIHLARHRDIRPWLRTGLVALPLFLPLWILRAEHYFDLGFQVIELAGDNVGSAVPEGSGTFITFLDYQNAAVTYLPLALAGALFLAKRRDHLLPALAVLMAFLNVALQLFFFHRFLIMLDFVALGLVATAFVATVPPLRAWVRPVGITLLVVLTAVPTLQQATAPPGPPFLWISDPQHDAILWIRDHTEPNATVLASNLDGPYVIADSGRRTYGPGLFDDPHDRTAWRRFFGTQDEAAIREHLDDYPRPLYLYHAEGHGAGLGTAKFRPPLFELVHDAGGAKVWRYVGSEAT